MTKTIKIHKWGRFQGQSKLDKRHGTIGTTHCGHPVGPGWSETTKKATCPICNYGNRGALREEDTRVRTR